MQVKIQNWDNRCVVCLSEDLMNQLDAKIGDVLDVEMKDGILLLGHAAPVYTMDDLLRGCTKQNTALDDEDLLWLNSPPVGTEFK